MADVKISQLSAASTNLSTDTFLIIQGGVNKKVTLTTLLKNLDSTDNIRINPNNNAISTTINGTSSNLLVANYNGTANNVAIKVGSSIDTAADLHVGNIVRFGGTLRSSTSSVQTGGVSPTALDLTYDTTLLGTSVASTNFFTLASGYYDSTVNYSVGQIKTLVWFSNAGGASGASPISIALTGLGFTNITMNKVGQSVVLKYSPSGWMCIATNKLSGTDIVFT